MKKWTICIALLMVTVLFAACGLFHSCENACDTCGLCLNESCTEKACTDKCQGHHTCASVCDTCDLCTNEACTESVCAEKCQGHHTCETICETCNLCADQTCTEAICTEKCPGHHCSNPCSLCGMCMNLDCTHEICAEKCNAVLAEAPDFGKPGFITTEETVIESDTLVFHIAPNVYVPGKVEVLSTHLVPAIEKVSDLSFGEDKVKFIILKNNSEEYIYPTVDPSANSVSASSSIYLVGHHTDNNSIGSLSKLLRYDQTNHESTNTLQYGFEYYTTYRAVQELMNTHPEYVWDAVLVHSATLSSYEALYAQPIEYWLENQFAPGEHGEYDIVGFQFMAYLDAVYGNYTKWLTALEEQYPSKITNYVAPAEIFEVIKASYDEDVFNNFYPWLKENEQTFAELEATSDKIGTDLRSKSAIIPYLTPAFDYGFAVSTIPNNIQYSNLYLNIDEAKQHLIHSENFDITKVVLELSDPVTVNLYGADGTCTTVTDKTKIDLKDISYIQLVGEGELNYLSVFAYGNSK